MPEPASRSRNCCTSGRSLPARMTPSVSSSVILAWRCTASGMSSQRVAVTNPANSSICRPIAYPLGPGIEQAQHETRRNQNQKGAEGDLERAPRQTVREAGPQRRDIARNRRNQEDAEDRDKADRQGRHLALMRQAGEHIAQGAGGCDRDADAGGGRDSLVDRLAVERQKD